MRPIRLLLLETDKSDRIKSHLSIIKDLATLALPFESFTKEYSSGNYDVALMDLSLFQDHFDKLKAVYDLYSTKTDMPLLCIVAELDQVQAEQLIAVGATDAVQNDLCSSYLLYKTITLSIRYKEIERNLRIEQSINENNSELTSLGEIAMSIAHEIKSPLTVIRLSQEILRKKIPALTTDPRTLSALTLLQKDIDRMTTIIDNLLSYTKKKTTLQFNQTPFSKIIDDTLSLTQTALQSSKIPLILTEGLTNLSVECWPFAISQVLTNLISNSIHAVKNLEKKWIELSYSVSENYLYLTITDSGSGIPKEIREQLFHSKFTTKHDGSGNGIGLRICKKIMEGHSGDLILDHHCHHTRFLLVLPLKQIFKNDSPYSQPNHYWTILTGEGRSDQEHQTRCQGCNVTSCSRSGKEIDHQKSETT